MQSE
jgi:hypothetical protein